MHAFREEIQTYSGTATKWSQRAVNTHTAQEQHVLFSLDISAAFLKGLTFEEIAKETGTTLRSVQFDFPKADAWLLRKLPGMEDFDAQAEVLDLLNAMWGLKDAPRAFTMRLARTLGSLDYVQGITDRQTWRKFSKTGDKKLCTILTTHIGDIKGA